MEVVSQKFNVLRRQKIKHKICTPKELSKLTGKENCKILGGGPHALSNHFLCNFVCAICLIIYYKCIPIIAYTNLQLQS